MIGVDCADGTSGMIRMIKELEPLDDLEPSSEMEPSKGRSQWERSKKEVVSHKLSASWMGPPLTLNCHGPLFQE